jgi:hypothetical protein
MSPWTFNVKFPYGTQFIFGLLMFVVGEDENLKMLSPGSAPECLTLVYGQAPCPPAISSISGSAFAGLDPYAGPYIRTAKLVRDISIVTSTFHHRLEHRAIHHW